MDDSEIKRTIFVGNLAEKVSEDIIYELALQSGPIDSVKIPQDRNTGNRKNFGFVCFHHESTVPYAIHMLNGISLFGRNINVQNRDKSPLISCEDVGIHQISQINGLERQSDDDSYLEPVMEEQQRSSNLSTDLQNRLGNRSSTRESSRNSYSNKMTEDRKHYHHERNSGNYNRRDYNSGREDRPRGERRENRDHHSSSYRNSHSSRQEDRHNHNNYSRNQQQYDGYNGGSYQQIPYPEAVNFNNVIYGGQGQQLQGYSYNMQGQIHQNGNTGYYHPAQQNNQGYNNSGHGNYAGYNQGYRNY